MLNHISDAGEGSFPVAGLIVQVQVYDKGAALDIAVKYTAGDKGITARKVEAAMVDGFVVDISFVFIAVYVPALNAYVSDICQLSDSLAHGILAEG